MRGLRIRVFLGMVLGFLCFGAFAQSVTVAGADVSYAHAVPNSSIAVLFSQWRATQQARAGKLVFAGENGRVILRRIPTLASAVTASSDMR
jgi:hypothetical protein